MKSFKKSAYMLTLLAALGLAGCNNTPASSESSNTATSEATSEKTSETSSELPSSSTTEDTSSVVTDPVEHFPDYTMEAPADAVTRKYDERFDTPVEDFTAESLAGTGSAKKNDGFLRVVVDSALPADRFPTNEDASIFKYATGTIDIQSYAGIGFRMRVKEGKIGLKNLALRLRGDDAMQTYPIQLAEASDVDGEALPELSGEFQDIIISPQQTIEDADTKYLNRDGTESSLVVLEKILGFHLVANEEEVGGILEIDSVFVVSENGEQKMIDSFNHATKNNAAEVETPGWWQDSTGFIVRRGVNVTGADYKTAKFTEEHTDIVLEMLGDTTGATLTGIKEDGSETAAVAWADVKDHEGKAVVNAVNGAYVPLAINLANTFGTEDKIAQVKIASSKELYISNIFLTSHEVPNLDKTYPHLDTEKASVIDNFNRVQEKLDTNWDDSTVNPVVKAAGLNGFLTYTGDQPVSVDGSSLVMGPSGYVNAVIGSPRAVKGYQYIVFSMKAESEADLKNFRFDFGSGAQATWIKDAVAKEGVPTIPTEEDYAYTQGDYTWYIVDLEMAGIDVHDALNLHYNGENALKIDSIFLANEDLNLEKTMSRAMDKVDLDLTGYQYITGIDDFASRYLYLTMKGDGKTNLVDLRVEHNGQTLWAHNSDPGNKSPELVMFDLATGAAYDYATPLSTEGQTIVIDLEATGFDPAKGVLHIHMGGSNPGLMTITEVGAMDSVGYVKNLTYYPGDGSPFAGDGYHYMGNSPIDEAYERISFHLEGDVNLIEFRAAYNGAEGWPAQSNKLLPLKNAATGELVDPNEVLPEGGIDVYFDWADSPFTYKEGEPMHFHFAAAAGKSLTISNVKGSYAKTPYNVVVSNYNQVFDVVVEGE